LGGARRPGDGYGDEVGVIAGQLQKLTPGAVGAPEETQQ
jgi:hypothetical protein